jgi:hypothetical protein
MAAGRDLLAAQKGCADRLGRVHGRLPYVDATIIPGSNPGYNITRIKLSRALSTK